MDNPFYFLMDGRANHSINDATVLLTCESIEEVFGAINDFGVDTCVVNEEMDTVLDSLTWQDHPFLSQFRDVKKGPDGYLIIKPKTKGVDI